MMHPSDAAPGCLVLSPCKRNVSQSRVVAKHEFPGNGVRFIMFIPGLGFLLYQSPVICHPPCGIGLQLSLLGILVMPSGQVGGELSISAPVVQEVTRVDSPLSAV